MDGWMDGWMDGYPYEDGGMDRQIDGMADSGQVRIDH